MLHVERLCACRTTAKKANIGCSCSYTLYTLSLSKISHFSTWSGTLIYVLRRKKLNYDLRTQTTHNFINSSTTYKKKKSTQTSTIFDCYTLQICLLQSNYYELLTFSAIVKLFFFLREWIYEWCITNEFNIFMKYKLRIREIILLLEASKTL